ncbi:prepilin peptidase [Mesobacillus zeae]|uniref:Prepilin peptidase n=1 Tax=Mesobacillus zeae TaxID=1917180 RepID=A0A398B0N5_9BACI|nr:A24 family peptidase [Mesobacillus zeae]RID83261.1 prepilin peptidase [Mesobacillus zeae]
MYTTLLFLYGVVFGSFFNVVGLRVPEGKSIVAPGSACPACGHRLRSMELIPVVSYLIQKGQCRSCGGSISLVYPLAELTTGILFAAASYLIGWNWELFAALALISLFMIITVSDFAYMIIPNKVLLVFAGIFLLIRAVAPLSPWWDSLAGAVAGFLLLLFISIISRGGMGMGDVKLFAVIGMAVGLKTMLLSFFFATFFGAFFGIVGLMAGLVKRKQPIPFGPFIAIGTLTAYFFGDAIVHAYLTMLSSGF